jgi:hypothetical protein
METEPKKYSEDMKLRHGIVILSELTGCLYFSILELIFEILYRNLVVICNCIPCVQII